MLEVIYLYLLKKCLKYYFLPTYCGYFWFWLSEMEISCGTTWGAVMVRALEPAQLSSNRVSINALARILLSSTRESIDSTQLELKCPARWVRSSQFEPNNIASGTSATHWSIAIILLQWVVNNCKQIAVFFGLAQLDSSRTWHGSTQLEVFFIKVWLSSIGYWLDSAQLEKLLARTIPSRLLIKNV